MEMLVFRQTYNVIIVYFFCSCLPDHRSSCAVLVVSEGAIVSTDGWSDYNGLSALGYQHKRRVQSGSDDPAHVVLPGPHRIASLLKRWLIGTRQGAVRDEHLDYYLDEYTFRFNRRSAKARGLLFHRLVEQAVQIKPTTYRGIVTRAAKPSTRS